MIKLHHPTLSGVTARVPEALAPNWEASGWRRPEPAPAPVAVADEVPAGEAEAAPAPKKRRPRRATPKG